MRQFLLFLIVILVFAINGLGQSDDKLELFSDYLNKYVNVRDIAISNAGNEAYVTVQSPDQDISQIVRLSKNTRNQWGSSVLEPFCQGFSCLEPFLTKDGLRLYFASDRPLDETTKTKKDFDIWYVERPTAKSAWSKPKNVGSPVNSKLDEFYPSIAENGNLYFTSDSPNGLGKDDIYVSRFENGVYSQPKLLDENINGSGHEFNAFITEDEKFLFFTKYNAEGGFGSGDLYVSKMSDDGKWSSALNLGEKINSKYMEYCPFYYQKNKILYFTSRRIDLKRKPFANIDEMLEYISGAGNGLSKIYKVKLDLTTLKF